MHARSASAAAIDEVTGELVRQRLVPEQRVGIDWVRALPGPAAVAYEAGPTGFGLARAFIAAGIRCEVAAPSKIIRPSGDRVLDDIVAVRVPTVAEEAARDLVRAREDVRVDLMRIRHRISKLLLRHGHVYYGGQAWTGKHEQWLDRIGFPGLERAGTQAAYDADREAHTLAVLRRQRLDEQILALAADSEFTAVIHQLCCLRGISTLTGFALPVEIGDWHRFTGATMRARWAQAPAAAQARGHAGNQRLHDRWTRLATGH